MTTPAPGTEPGTRGTAKALPRSKRADAPWPHSPWTRVAQDALLAALLAAVLWFTVPAPTPTLQLVQGGLAALAVLGVGLRSQYPATGFALALGASLPAAWLGLTADPLLLASLALFPVAVARGRRALPPVLIWAITALLLLTALIDASGAALPLRQALLSGIAVAAAWALGVGTRQRRELSAKNAAHEERSRLARDVHDILSHSLGTIGVQAGVAAHVDGLSTERLRTILREIEDLARGGITELSVLLAATRAHPAALEHPALLSDVLTATAQTARSAGIPTRLELSDVDALPLAHRTVVHRIVREAVTNTIRHAGPCRCTITVAAAGDTVRLLVTDTGRGQSPHSPVGHGLTGARERVELMNGSFLAGAGASGGFRVEATLPLPEGGESRHG